MQQALDMEEEEIDQPDDVDMNLPEVEMNPPLVVVEAAEVAAAEEVIEVEAAQADKREEGEVEGTVAAAVGITLHPPMVDGWGRGIPVELGKSAIGEMNDGGVGEDAMTC